MTGMQSVELKKQHVEMGSVVGASRAGDELARSDGFCLRPPRWIILCINNICNLKCKMCDVGLGDRRTVFWANLVGDQPQNMSLDLLQEVVRQAAEFVPQPRIGLAFTEPLIHPQILEFARAIVNHDLHCAITSNGTTLPRFAEALVEIGIQELSISIDGPRQVHNQVRGGHLTFEKLYRGMELLNAAKKKRNTLYPKVTFSFTITELNYSHILEFIQEVEDLRPSRIVISQLNFITEAMAEAHNAAYGGDLAVLRSNLGTMDPTAFQISVIAEELDRVLSYAASRGEDFPSLSIVPDFTSPSQLGTYYQEPQTFVGGRQCTDPWKMMMVKTDGAVIPAHGRCYNYPVGNLKDSRLPDLWNSPRFIEFRKTLQAAGGTLPACSRCCGCISKPVISKQ